MFPYWREQDGTWRKKNKSSETTLKSKRQWFVREDKRYSWGIKQSIERSLPNLVIFPKIRISPFPHHTSNPENKSRELFRNIFPHIFVDAFNLVSQPLKRLIYMTIWKLIKIHLFCSEKFFTSDTSKYIRETTKIYSFDIWFFEPTTSDPS